MAGNGISTKQFCLLVEVLKDVSEAGALTLQQWDLLIRQARRADLLGRIAALVDEKGLLGAVPVQPRSHLVAASIHAQKHAQVMRWEIECIQKAIGELGIPVIYLKGAAYVLRNLPPARGRIYSDIDIMVPREALGKIEKALMIHGWSAIKLDAYDQRYYRQWMHEIPPLQHRRRQTIIDVHHRILPETTKAQPDPISMFSAAERVEDYSNCFTLSPVDMVIHSATHLFYEGEYDHGLRDLTDLDDLFRNFSQIPDFWPILANRAYELQLATPLYYSLRYCERILQTPIPADVWRSKKIWRPTPAKRMLMDNLFERALMPIHASCAKKFTSIARFLLYLRSHYMRMPLYLLIPHLMRKFIRREDTT